MENSPHISNRCLKGDITGAIHHYRVLMQRGLTLIELMLAMFASSILLATLLLSHQTLFLSFDDQLSDISTRTELRYALDQIQRDLLDAKSISYPPPTGLLLSFVLHSDSLLYSYYLDASNNLRREQGSTGSGGETLALQLDPASTSITQAGKIFVINLSSAASTHDNQLNTSVRPRNL